ncbi:MAG: T9SS type A sorting domain-containing protein, partial [Bacteroidia bacterium]
STNDGSNPRANVTEYNGILYTTTFSSGIGTTAKGAVNTGHNGSGNGSYVLFNGTTDGANPYGGLMNATNGMMYGTTFTGGTSDSGVVYQFNPNLNTITKLHDFLSFDGGNPIGNLLEVCGKAPSQPGTISLTGGNAKVCPGESRTYSVPDDIGATFYYWSITTGATISSGQGTKQVVLLFDNSFIASSVTLSCTAQNDCASSTPRTLTISRNNPVSTITPLGSTTFCAGGNVVLQANSGTGITYQWKQGANNIAGATTQNYVATTTGTYKVVVTNTIGCSKASIGLAVTVNCKSGNEENKAGGLVIYPNPAVEEINLIYDASSMENYEVEILDLTGRIMLNKKGVTVTGTNNIKCDLNDFTNGIYILKLQSDSKTFEQRIAKQ